MRWVTLFDKIGKMQMKISQHEDVHAILRQPDGSFAPVYLALKYDAKGKPYFVQDDKVQAKHQAQTAS